MMHPFLQCDSVAAAAQLVMAAIGLATLLVQWLFFGR